MSSIILKEEELEKWLDSVTFVDSTEYFVDDIGNYEGERIFEKDGKLWSLDYCNKHPDSRWDYKIGKHGGGYVYGEYEIFEVEEKIEIETITKYCKKNDVVLPKSEIKTINQVLEDYELKFRTLSNFNPSVSESIKDFIKEEIKEVLNVLRFSKTVIPEEYLGSVSIYNNFATSVDKKIDEIIR